MLATLAVGALAYGLSLVLDMRALRLLGAAREAAYFATAPFFGAILAVAWLGDCPSLLHGAAAAAMVGGVVLLRFDRHEHPHTHDVVEHEHLHVHDAHHQHDHTGLPDVTLPVHEPHSHRHRHERLIHSHPHVSDAHHRHGHGRVHSR